MDSELNRSRSDSMAEGPRSAGGGAGSSAALPRAGEVEGSAECTGWRESGHDVLLRGDMELIQAAYSFVIQQARCKVCQHPFRLPFRVEVEGSRAEGAWIATVSSRCDGWGRHLSGAQAWVSREGLHLGSFRRRT